MQESKLLGTLLPSMPAMHAILEKIRDKYNIPPVLPEDEQLAETLRAERTPEEWQAVFDDLEWDVRAEVPIVPSAPTNILEGALKIARHVARRQALVLPCQARWRPAQRCADLDLNPACRNSHHPLTTQNICSIMTCGPFLGSPRLLPRRCPKHANASPAL